MKLNELMNNYLGQEVKSIDPLRDIVPNNLVKEQIELPLEVVESKWDIKSNPERLQRIFRFDDINARNWFLSEIFENEKSNQHYGKITIEGKDVKVEVQTHSLNKVTELDQEYASYCDDVWQDVDFISGRIDSNE